MRSSARARRAAAQQERPALGDQRGPSIQRRASPSSPGDKVVVEVRHRQALQAALGLLQVAAGQVLIQQGAHLAAQRLDGRQPAVPARVKALGRVLGAQHDACGGMVWRGAGGGALGARVSGWVSGWGTGRGASSALLPPAARAHPSRPPPPGPGSPAPAGARSPPGSGAAAPRRRSRGLQGSHCIDG